MKNTKKLLAKLTKKNKILSKKASTHFKMNAHLSEPWFSLIATGLKTVEGRINKPGKFTDLSIGDHITFHNDDFNHREITVKVIRKTKYNNFKSYLESETLAKTVPGQPNIDHGLSVYYKYYTKELEKEYGILAIEFILI